LNRVTVKTTSTGWAVAAEVWVVFM
jgi:hypothetical protein